jgi:hypothetical protein
MLSCEEIMVSAFFVPSSLPFSHARVCAREVKITGDLEGGRSDGWHMWLFFTRLPVQFLADGGTCDGSHVHLRWG